MGNIVRAFNISKTYVDKDDQLLGILSTLSFEIFSTTDRLEGYSLGQLLFGHDIFYQDNHIMAK